MVVLARSLHLRRLGRDRLVCPLRAMASKPWQEAQGRDPEIASLDSHPPDGGRGKIRRA